MRIRRLNQRGDTIVEVMLATAILSMVLAGAFTISNRATRINQTASEHTEVSNLMQQQAELLKIKHIQDSTNFWPAIDSLYTPSVAENSGFCDSSPAPAVNGFYVADDLSLHDADLSGGKVTDGDTTDLYNIWVEAKSGTGHTDFFVYACWQGIGSEGLQRSGLVMRLAR